MSALPLSCAAALWPLLLLAGSCGDGLYDGRGLRIFNTDSEAGGQGGASGSATPEDAAIPSPDMPVRPDTASADLGSTDGPLPQKQCATLRGIGGVIQIEGASLIVDRFLLNQDTMICLSRIPLPMAGAIGTAVEVRMARRPDSTFKLEMKIDPRSFDMGPLGLGYISANQAGTPFWILAPEPGQAASNPDAGLLISQVIKDSYREEFPADGGIKSELPYRAVYAPAISCAQTKCTCIRCACVGTICQ